MSVERGVISGPDRERELIAAALRQIRPSSPLHEAETQGVTPAPSGTAPPRGPGTEPFPPDLFPGYQVIREVHRGGQGVVYQAIQKATKRKVAIKVMREGPFAGPKDRIRFEREVEVLAALDHPNIVAIHDRGEAGGLFYFVMDYISGRSLDGYAAESRRSIDETIALFTKICDAVNAAHLRGVIHRDLKPGNIRIDANGEPHVLDFGLAKVATGEVTGASTPQVMTMTGQFVGSMPWASPEQAEGRTEKIDVRTDVYSLGVMLYQSLTGRFPYQVIGNMRDVLDNILRATPARPSTVRRGINNEVETIVLKCLSKERERRYQSAGELGRDLRCYLAGEPIEAKRDSGWYVVSKTLSRHRGAALALATVAASLVIGLLVSLKFWRDAGAERDAAESARRLSVVTAVFLDDTLTSVDPDIAAGRDTSLLEEILARAAERVEAELADPHPEAAASVHDTIGRTYLKLGKLPEAERHLRAGLAERRRRLGDGHADVAASRTHLAELLVRAGKPAEGEAEARGALAARRALAPADHLGTAEALLVLGFALKRQAEESEAEACYTEGLAMRERMLGPDHLDVAEAASYLGQLYFSQRRYDRAEPPLRRALAIVTKSLGPNTTPVLAAKGNLASLLRERDSPGDLGRATGLLREVEASCRALLDPGHPLIATALNKLGLALFASNDLAGAERALTEALAIRRGRLGPEHTDTAVALANLGLVLQGQGKLDEAAAAFMESRGAFRRTLGEGSPWYAACLERSADLARLTGDHAGALELAGGALTIRRTRPDDATAIGDALTLLGRCLTESGRAGEAEAPLREAAGLYGGAGAPPAESAKAALGRGALGACLAELGRFAEAEPLLLHASRTIRSARAPGHPLAIEAAQRLVGLYDAWGKPAAAHEQRLLLENK